MSGILLKRKRKTKKVAINNKQSGLIGLLKSLHNILKLQSFISLDLTLSTLNRKYFSLNF